MKKYIISILTMFAVGSSIFAVPALAHGMGHGHMKNANPQQHQAHLDSRLTALVAQGKITEAQKKLIEDKFKSLFDQNQKIKSDLKGKTKDERRAAHEKMRADLEKWAKDNGIDLKLIFSQMGHGKLKNK